MAAILAAASTSLIAFGCMAAVTAAIWGTQKYREAQAEKRSEELRNLYASVHSEQRRRAS
jgi:hypothetical protein